MMSGPQAASRIISAIVDIGVYLVQGQNKQRSVLKLTMPLGWCELMGVGDRLKIASILIRTKGDNPHVAFPPSNHADGSSSFCVSPAFPGPQSTSVCFLIHPHH